jgi:hypothetical protein
MISARAIVLNLIFTSIFILVFDWGLVALPLSVSLVALLNLFQLAFALSKRLGSLTSGDRLPGLFHEDDHPLLRYCRPDLDNAIFPLSRRGRFHGALDFPRGDDPGGGAPYFGIAGSSRSRKGLI